jgi:5-methylcytosine-specific restriction endonuclease McrA
MWPPVTITCDWCGKTKQISPSARKEHNFCNRKCCRAWQQANGIVGVPWKLVALTCPVCGKSFQRQQNAVDRSKTSYCSKACFYVAHSPAMGGDKNPAWRGGLEPYYGPNWDRQSREARQRDGHTCQRCGITEVETGEVLHVHHIVPLRTFARDFRKANALHNLVSLCPSCHKFLEWHEDQMTLFLASWRATNQDDPSPSRSIQD